MEVVNCSSSKTLHQRYENLAKDASILLVGPEDDDSPALDENLNRTGLLLEQTNTLLSLLYNHSEGPGQCHRMRKTGVKTEPEEVKLDSAEKLNVIRLDNFDNKCLTVSEIHLSNSPFIGIRDKKVKRSHSTEHTKKQRRPHKINNDIAIKQEINIYEPCIPRKDSSTKFYVDAVNCPGCNQTFPTRKTPKKSCHHSSYYKHCCNECPEYRKLGLLRSCDDCKLTFLCIISLHCHNRSAQHLMILNDKQAFIGDFK